MDTAKHDWLITYYDERSLQTGEQETIHDKTAKELQEEIMKRDDSDNYQLEIALVEDPQYPVLWWDGNGFQEI